MDDIDDILSEFLIEAHDGLEQLDRDLIQLESESESPEVIGQIFRTVHSIKGSSGFLALDRLGEITHRGENLLCLLRDGSISPTTEVTDVLLAMVDAIRGILAHLERDRTEGDHDHKPLLKQLETVTSEHLAHRRDGGAATKTATPSAKGTTDAPSIATSSLRVDVELLDQLMTLVGELVLARNQILQVGSSLEDSGLVGTCQRLNLVTTELQEGVMKTRMQPIGSAWTKFPRVVRDLGISCGKRVQLEMSGEETELDKTIIESIKDPLTHAIRNAVDHGIESEEDRLADGKSANGTLQLRAFHEGGQVNIEVIDDGRGIDPEAIRAKAVSNGMLSADRAAAISDREALQLIMEPGFSTAAKVTSVSGRGVGMDVVKTNIEKIGGTIDLHSVVGSGTTLRIRIPLTLAIIPALIVASGGERFAIPQANLLELVRLESDTGDRSGIENIDGTPVYRLRGQLLPLVHLGRVLHHDVSEGAPDNSSLVVLQAEGRQFGLVVEEILDTEEIVVKPLGKQLGGLRTLAGAAIMGDGRVALILDVNGLAQQAGLTDDRGGGNGLDTGKPDETAARESWLLVGVGDRRLALDLANVARLEELEAYKVEHTGGRRVVQYRGQIMPLLLLRETFGIPDEPPGDGPLQVIVVRDPQGRYAGLVVDTILDIVDEVASVMQHNGCAGVSGAATLQGRVTDLLDVHGLVANEYLTLGIATCEEVTQ